MPLTFIIPTPSPYSARGVTANGTKEWRDYPIWGVHRGQTDLHTVDGYDPLVVRLH